MEELSRNDTLLKLIMDLGGEGTRQEINELIPQYWNLREDDKAIEPIPRKPYYWHRADACRQALKDRHGFLDLVGNIWKVTEKGIEYLKKKGLYNEKLEKTRLTKVEGKKRQIAVMQLLYENQDKVCNMGLIVTMFPEYYSVSDSEYEKDAQGRLKYYKTVGGILSSLKKQNKVNNPEHEWQLTEKGIKELNPPLAEKEFYEPFKQWMSKKFQCETEICANNRRRGYYSNPDLRGKKGSDTIAIEMKSSENINDCLKGLFQALNYQLCNNQSYLVVPRLTENFERISKLSQRLGIGLIVFDNTSSINPSFEIVFDAKKENLTVEDFE